MKLRLLSASMIGSICLLLLWAPGCDRSDVAAAKGKRGAADELYVPEGGLTESQEKLREETFKSLAAAEQLPAPEAVFVLPKVQGWTEPEPHSLPGDGLSVGYNHESGMTVTVYQFKRGLSEIPNDIRSQVVRQEFANSRSGLDEAVAMGLYDKVEPKEEGIVNLGESQTEALHAKFIVTRGGIRSATELFIWSYKNHFLKIRLTSTPRRSKSKKAALEALLTAIGNATG